MGNMKKRTISISLFYLKYFVFLSIGILFVTGIWLMGFNALVTGGEIYPANYAELMAKDASDQLKRLSQISGDMIPDLCQYVLFTTGGSMKDGNLSAKEQKAAWKAVEESKSDLGIKTDGKGNFYMVIDRAGEYLVLRYQIIPQYRSPVLRRYLLPPQNLFLLGALLSVLLSIACTAFCFGRALQKRLSPLLAATGKIQGQELDFTVEHSEIKEIDAVLESVEKMRAALKESLEKQWQQEQARRDQIAALAHDLKTPLTLVRGNAELLGDGKLEADQKECVDYIENSALQMQEYVQMLIEISKTGSVLPLKKEKIVLDLFLEEVQNQCKGLCTAKRIRLQCNNRCEGKTVVLDRSLFTRALLNVLSNAVESTPEEGSIFLEIYEEKEKIVFAVSDTGSGFSPEALKHATEQFFMDDQSRSGKMHFGMGLTIAKAVAEQHGGRLIWENVGETGGAKVIMKMNCGEAKGLLEEITDVVRECGEIILHADRSRNHIDEKAGHANFVTEYDKKIQQILKERFLQILPEAVFVGEEEDIHASIGSGYAFIVDPIDGTTNFIKDYRVSAISVGLLSNGEKYMGVVYNPYSDEMFTAVKGEGAYLNGKPIHVSSQPLENGIVLFGTAPYYEELSRQSFDMAYQYFKKALDIRRSGSAAIDLCSVAAGRAEVFFELRLAPWDFAAGALIVEEAGGKVTTVQGEAPTLSEGCSILATNGIQSTVMEQCI